jgi:hypothetical protein
MPPAYVLVANHSKGRTDWRVDIGGRTDFDGPERLEGAAHPREGCAPSRRRSIYDYTIRETYF